MSLIDFLLKFYWIRLACDWSDNFKLMIKPPQDVFMALDSQNPYYRP